MIMLSVRCCLAYSEISNNHDRRFLVDKLGHVDLASSLVQRAVRVSGRYPSSSQKLGKEISQ